MRRDDGKEYYQSVSVDAWQMVDENHSRVPTYSDNGVEPEGHVSWRAPVPPANMSHVASRDNITKLYAMEVFINPGFRASVSSGT